MKPLKIVLLVAILALVLLLPSTFYTVEETELGVVTRFGRVVRTSVEPGLHFKAPWPIDAVLRVDRRLLVFDHEPTEMLTRDKKNVLIDSFLAWKVADPVRFVETVRTRPEAEARLLDLLSAELGAAVGAEPITSFMSPNPEEVEIRKVAERARKRVEGVARESFGIEVVDLEINGFNFPSQNRKSVIERMRAERARIATGYRSEGEEEALKIEAAAEAEREEILARARAEAEKLRGAGEAEALEILAKAYREDPELYRFLRSLESYEKIVDENTVFFIESDSELMETLHGR